MASSLTHVALPRRYFAPLAFLPDGWAQSVGFAVDDHGCFADVTVGGAPGQATRIAGPMLPGMPNAHSHAFQRAMVGLTHRAGPVADNFWSWRTRMYALAQRLTPEQIEAIATWVYVEMLRGGYTHVCEFHYLHNDVGGRIYADPAELSRVMLRAARTAGIGMTLLPVLYMAGGFGGAPARDEQRRFLSTPERLLGVIGSLKRELAASPSLAFGLAPHSLRAVPPGALTEAVQGLRGLDPDAPIHIHVAEQSGEVDACLQWSGKRPVEWLLEHQPVDARWSLVHATHMTAAEIARAAASGANAVICATTEADLGDGIFDYPGWRDHNGRIAIGTDSQVSRDWWSELRMLEYSQRLARRARNVAAASSGQSSGEQLVHAALAGGAAASGLPLGRIEDGSRADWLVVRGDKLAFAGRDPESYIDSLLFDHHDADYADVVVAGQSVAGSICGEPAQAARARFVAAIGNIR